MYRINDVMVMAPKAHVRPRAEAMENQQHQRARSKDKTVTCWSGRFGMSRKVQRHRTNLGALEKRGTRWYRSPMW